MNAPIDASAAEELHGASRRLAAFVAGLRFDDLPAGTVHAAKRALLDYVSCAVAGSAMPVSRALADYFEQEDASRHASVIGSGLRLSAPNAALLNGANTHGLDFDDGHTQGSAHPAGAVFPAVLAAAQRHGAAPREILAAAAAGYDVMLRIAATVHPSSARRGYHNTAIAGVFGAAAGAASILRLDAEATLNALGLAGSFAGGIREYLEEGAEIKRLHPGKAARDGLLCAELARRGITGPTRVLEGRLGFLNVFGNGQIRPAALLQDLGRRHAIAEVYFKPYPCCRHYHAVLDGIRQLHAEHDFGTQDVERAEVGLYAVGALGHDHQHCETLLEAQMSAPCAAAMAIADGDVTAPMFLPDNLARADLADLMRRIYTVVDPECERIYPGVRSGAVTLALKDGRSLHARIVEPKGERANPLTDADLEHKFRANCEPLIGAARGAELLQAIWGFERLDDAGALYRW
ncbi:MmgE/PrpD family protein [Pigmentiphaga soli]|uniref:MmgE/PrpD family protein n=1 Tax=Pigmentiphaga soli TaxID=1007095 RepID=A0ABP8H0P0_9BURK